MSVEMLQEMMWYFYISTGFFSCITLVLFFRFQIWKIVGDLSGVNAKRGIKKISNQRRVEEYDSHGFLNMKSMQEEKTESFLCTEDTGTLEPEREDGNYYVIEKMEYIASGEWIE